MDLNLNQRPLTKALEEVAGWYNLILDRRVVDQLRGTVTARAYNPVTLDAILTVLTDMAGLRQVVLDDALYVTSPANAATMEAELANQRAAASAKKSKEEAK